MQGLLCWKKPFFRHVSMITGSVLMMLVLIGTFLAMPSPARADGSLPGLWMDKDIGGVGATGSASYTAATSTFTVAGSGSDIWGTTDQFHYVYRPLSGDGQIIARVASLTQTSIWAKAGLMLRETLTPNSRNAMIGITAGTVATFQWRAATGAKSASTHGPVVHAPYWVKLLRTGSTFTGSISSDGTNWRTVGTAMFSMPAQVYIGLVVTAHNNHALNTATFDTVSATGVASQGTIVARSMVGPRTPVGQIVSVTATCQAGEQLISGGYQVNAFEADNVTENYPSAANAWTVTDDNTFAPSYVQVTAIAYCLQANYSIGTIIVSAAGSSTIAATCPADAVVTGGGFRQVGATLSAPTANGWKSSGGTVYVICATQNFAAGANASTSFIVYAGGPIGGSATCGTGQLATGGGFSLASSYDPILSSVRTDTNGWSMTVYGLSYSNPTMTVSAVCVFPPTLGSSPTSPPTLIPTPTP